MSERHPSKPIPISAPALPPRGRRLSAFSAEWTKIGASKWVLKRTLLEGYSLPFSSLPPLTFPVFLASYQNPEKRRALHVAVKEMEMKGAIEVVRTPSPGFSVGSFSAESPGDMDVYNRPLGSEHPHPVSVLLDGDQWVTSQGLNSPLLRAVPPVLPRGRGLAIPSSSFLG